MAASDGLTVGKGGPLILKGCVRYSFASLFLCV